MISERKIDLSHSAVWNLRFNLLAQTLLSGFWDQSWLLAISPWLQAITSTLTSRGIEMASHLSRARASHDCLTGSLSLRAQILKKFKLA